MNVDIPQFAITLILQVLFVMAAAVQLFFYFFFFMRLAFYRKGKRNTAQPPVSVIIAARHEADNLKRNLPQILTQKYPDYEVIVVDDGSRDETPEILEAFQQQYSHLRVVKGFGDDRARGGKKLALTLGIKAASHDRLLFTDADCKPLSTTWIAELIAAIAGSGDLVLGYSPYVREKGWLNRLIRFETFYTAVNYFSFALSGIPYMGVGRNLSYTRSDFFRVSGFKKHYSLASGDDDLFINEIANKTNARVCLNEAAHVESIPKKSLKAYWFQKRRHLYTGWRYKPLHKVLLALQPLSFLIFLLSAIALLVINNWLYIVVLTLSFRVLLQFFTFRQISRWLGQADIVFLTPLLEIVVIVMSGFLHIANATAKPKKWKN